MSRHNGISRDEKESQYLIRLGDKIRVARKQRGYSQEEFAEIAGFSRSYYTEIETGKRNVSILNLVKVMQALDIDPETVIDSIKVK
jgi:transcriptional regulator with XRE-family HTH domain